MDPCGVATLVRLCNLVCRAVSHKARRAPAWCAPSLSTNSAIVIRSSNPIFEGRMGIVDGWPVLGVVPSSSSSPCRSRVKTFPYASTTFPPKQDKSDS